MAEDKWRLRRRRIWNWRDLLSVIPTLTPAQAGINIFNIIYINIININIINYCGEEEDLEGRIGETSVSSQHLHKLAESGENCDLALKWEQYYHRGALF